MVKDGDVTQLTKCSPSMYKTLGSIPRTMLTSSGETSDPSTKETEAGRSEDQGHPQLHSKFTLRLGSMRPCVQKNKKKKYHYSVKSLLIFDFHLSRWSPF